MVVAGLIVAVGLYAAFALNRSAEKVQTEQVAAETTQTLGAVADPLLRLCREDPTIRDRVGRACDTASQAVTEVAVRGARGLPGTPGVAGTPGIAGQDGRDGVDGIGTPGTPGTPGEDGADGMSPPCLSEPGQCRGAPGKDGQDGQDGVDGADSTVPGPAGPPGPTCPEGTALQPVTFASGEEGLGCVTGGGGG